MDLIINGFAVEAHFSPDEIENGLVPLLSLLTEKQRALGRRLTAFLSAPPAAGKSTLCAALEKLSREREGLTPVQALGLDGFHYPAAYIARHTVIRGGMEIPMRRVKGAPDTYDAGKLADLLAAVRRGEPVLWPGYSRLTHDVTPGETPVTADIVIVEGNWLLLPQKPWSDLACDVSIRLETDFSALRARLIARKMRGGLTESEAEAFYEETDGPNAALWLSESRKADITIRLDQQEGNI